MVKKKNNELIKHGACLHPFCALVLLAFAECEHGGGEPHVFGPGAVHLAEGDKPVERSRKVPAEPGLHPDAAQLLLGLLLLCAPLHGGIGTSVTCAAC